MIVLQGRELLLKRHRIANRGGRAGHVQRATEEESEEKGSPGDNRSGRGVRRRGCNHPLGHPQENDCNIGIAVGPLTASSGRPRFENVCRLPLSRASMPSDYSGRCRSTWS